MSKNRALVAKKTTLLRHDPGTVLAPGLFQSFRRGERKKLKLDVTYQFNESTQLRFLGFEPLGAEDLRLLQGIVALTGLSKAVVALDQPRGDMEKQLTLLLEPKLDMRREQSAAVRTNLQRLMAEIGYKTDGGDKRAEVRESLKRLANVTTYVKHNNKEQSYHLLSYSFDEKTNDLFVLVNPRLTKAIMGDHAFTPIDMREVRALKTDAARILHQRLCAVVDAGKQRTLRMETLIGYVWPMAAEGSTQRMRRFAIRAAIRELVATNGWLFTERPLGDYMVSRRKMGYEVPPSSSAVEEAQSAFN
jgi:hypothetical protein